MPGAEDFGDGPGLGDASTGDEGRLSVKDFSQSAHSIVVEVMGDRVEIGKGCMGTAMDPIVCQHERTQ